MTGETKEVKIAIAGLRPGMYVSRLDRPWLETSFPLQGVLIKSQRDIDRLKKVCAHVYVDVELGDSPSFQHMVMEPPPPSRPLTGSAEIDALRKRRYESTVTATEELRTAKAIEKDVTARISTVMEDLRAGKDLDVQKLIEGVRAMVGSVLRNPSAFMLLTQLKKADTYSYHHALTTSVWCASFGRHLGLMRADLELLALGGMLLDIGKVKLPAALLSKRGPLTEDDWQLLRSHVDQSVVILRATAGVASRVVEMVRCHHERYDGSGYPVGLAGRDIPIFGRIAAIADSYDAMTSVRVYRRALPPHEAMSELYDLRGRHYQAELVEQFIQATGVYPTGSVVELTTGEVAIIIELNDMRRLLPKVMVVLDEEKTPKHEFHVMDLAQVNSEGATEPVLIRQSLPPDAYGINPKEMFL
jgi:HD-GYP domain-containing protein (c-di-GMP phosphodiesterase class II)